MKYPGFFGDKFQISCPLNDIVLVIRQDMRDIRAILGQGNRMKL